MFISMAASTTLRQLSMQQQMEPHPMMIAKLLPKSLLLHSAAAPVEHLWFAWEVAKAMPEALLSAQSLPPTLVVVLCKALRWSYGQSWVPPVGREAQGPALGPGPTRSRLSGYPCVSALLVAEVAALQKLCPGPLLVPGPRRRRAMLTRSAGRTVPASTLPIPS